MWDLGEPTLIYGNCRLSFLLASNWFYVLQSSSEKGVILLLPPVHF